MINPNDPNEKELKKKTSEASTTAVRTADTRPSNVRPKVAKLIRKVVKENAPTWQELAKR